jgi:hypothetical protein
MTFRSRVASAALALGLAAGPAFAQTTPAAPAATPAPDTSSAPATASTTKKAVHHSAHKISHTTHKAVKKVKATTTAEPAAGSPGPGKQ